jgi:catechol 2,3-dioxygenase-like lactoylglutathione lyase family enzyme
MNISLGRTTLLVKDYDEAVHFYRDVFNARILSGQYDPAGRRSVHMVLGNDAHGIWLLQAESKTELLRTGQQTGDRPALVLYTDDLHACYMRLKEKNVTIKLEPAIHSGYHSFHCLDLYGNEIVIAQRTKP